MVCEKLALIIFLVGVSTALNAFNALHVAKIFPTKVITDIPSKLASKYLQYDKDNDKLTTSYTFPEEYKTTLYKDHEKQTTLVNVFPTVETKRPSLQYQTLDYQVLETSTTLVYEHLNSTVEYQTTPMLNSTLAYPITVPVQTFDYATVAYQHETLVYPTRINITHVTSTKLMNYTMVDIVDNHIPIV